MAEPTSEHDLLMNARTYYPALYRLFGGYFEQGWADKYGTWEDAVDAFVDETSPEERAETVQELDKLTASVPDHVVMSRVLHSGLLCNFVPGLEDLTEAEWFALVRAKLAA